jgi:hypothetical protein
MAIIALFALFWIQYLFVLLPTYKNWVNHAKFRIFSQRKSLGCEIFKKKCNFFQISPAATHNSTQKNEELKGWNFLIFFWAQDTSNLISTKLGRLVGVAKKGREKKFLKKK